MILLCIMKRVVVLAVPHRFFLHSFISVQTFYSGDLFVFFFHFIAYAVNLC